MKANKVKFWVRLGQIAYFIYCISYAFFETQLPQFVWPEFSGTETELICSLIAIGSIITFSEAIVRLIGYFAELIEEKT